VSYKWFFFRKDEYLQFVILREALKAGSVCGARGKMARRRRMHSCRNEAKKYKIKRQKKRSKRRCRQAIQGECISRKDNVDGHGGAAEKAKETADQKNEGRRIIVDYVL
jgi:hypothetical protein